jgi:TatA/E family protein of Tat protein translocase
MGIGVLEILIVVVIILIVFGGYKRLPQLGRSAGTGARKGGEKAKELAGRMRTKAEGVDTKKVSESVGKGVREVREVRDTVKGIASGEQPAGDEQRERSEDAPSRTAGDPSERPPPQRASER